ncbi:unnamed protein product, partial [Rotaria magnacalcarata]
MAGVRKQFAIIDDNTCGLTSSSITCSKDQSLKHYLPITFDNNTYDIEIDKNQVDLPIENTSYPEDYESSRSFSYSNENVVPKCLDITEKLTSIVEQLHSNDPIALDETKENSYNDETIKKDLMKMKHEFVYNEEGRNMPEKFAAPVGHIFENNQHAILPSSDRQELSMSVSDGLAFDSISSDVQRYFLCSSCQYLLIKPKCVTCGHRYCSHCIEKIIKSQSSAICSANNCGQMIKNNEIYPDFAVENDLDILTNIVCRNETKGCSWKGNYVSYRDHCQACTFETLQCEYCSKSITNRLLHGQHYEICPKAPVSCPLKKFGCNIQ